jgi:hypothetical protein
MDPEAQRRQDAEHLRLLALFHTIAGVLMVLFGCFPIVHVTVGIAALMGAGPPGEEMPRFVGVLFTVIGLSLMLLCWGLAACLLCASRCLRERRHHTFCLVVAGVSCLWMPIGTVLGIFTILVLVRPSVRADFGVGS